MQYGSPNLQDTKRPARLIATKRGIRVGVHGYFDYVLLSVTGI
jgi:hypothetical protein